MREASQDLVVINSDDPDDTTLLDVLDHVLNTGVIIRGNLVISLAGVDLVYVGLDVILTSIETALRHTQADSFGATSARRRTEPTKQTG
jgi:gas vesicle structural protein